MNNKITIIMSTFNDDRYLEKALRSVLMQTLKNWELIIINDNSSDNTEKIILSLFKNDNRLTYIKNETRLGVTKNIGRCITLAKTDLIARLDGDDFWTDKKKLTYQVDIMNKNKEIGVLGTWGQAVDENGLELYKIKYPTNDKKMRNRILHENPFITSSILFRRPEDYEKMVLNPENKYADDYHLILHIGIKMKFKNIKENCTAYRINSQGISQNKYVEQINDSIKIVKSFKKNYSGYYKARVLWSFRKYYPVWLKGKNSMNIKNLFKYYS